MFATLILSLTGSSHSTVRTCLLDGCTQHPNPHPQPHAVPTYHPNPTPNPTQVHAETVADVLKEAGLASAESEIVEITHKLNERNIFAADRPQLAYVIREPIVNRALAGCVRR